MFPKWLSQLLLNHFAVCAQYRFPTFHRFGLMVPEVFILCCLTHLSLGCGKSAHYDKATWLRRYGYLMAVKQDGSQGPLQRWPNFILLGLTVAFQHHHRLGMKSPAQFGDILDPIYGMDEEKKCHKLKDLQGTQEWTACGTHWIQMSNASQKFGYDT